MRGIGDPESTPTAFFVTVGVLVFVVVVLLVQGYFSSYVQELERARIVEQPIREVVEFEREQRQMLETYGWVDEERTAVRIPVEKAMERVAASGGRR